MSCRELQVNSRELSMALDSRGDVEGFSGAVKGSSGAVECSSGAVEDSRGALEGSRRAVEGQFGQLGNQFWPRKITPNGKWQLPYCQNRLPMIPSSL